MATMNKLNLKLIKRALVVARPCWISEEKRKAWGLLVLLVADTRFNVLLMLRPGNSLRRWRHATVAEPFLSGLAFEAPRFLSPAFQTGDG